MFVFYFVPFKFKRPFVDDFCSGGGGRRGRDKQMYISLKFKRRRKSVFLEGEHRGFQHGAGGARDKESNS